jgi:hypothetical protein
MQTKNDITQGAGWLGKNDILRDKLIALACHPKEKVNKTEELPKRL